MKIGAIGSVWGRGFAPQPRALLVRKGLREIDAASDTAKEVRASAMMVGPSTFFTVRRDQIVGLAARDGLPTI